MITMRYLINIKKICGYNNFVAGGRIRGENNKKEFGMSKTATEYKKALKILTEAVLRCEKLIDREMKTPSSPERGARIAHILNQLTISNQSAMHFELGYSFKKINKL